MSSEKAGEYVCENGHHVYYKSYPAGQVVLVNDRNEVLTAIRGREPAAGTYDILGGFCDVNETFKAAAIRELQEETGLKPADYTELEYLCEALDTYHYEGETYSAIGVVFWGRLKSSHRMAANDDVADLLWVPLDDFDLTKISPDFGVAITAIKTLQKRLGIKPSA